MEHSKTLLYNYKMLTLYNGLICTQLNFTQLINIRVKSNLLRSPSGSKEKQEDYNSR